MTSPDKQRMFQHENLLKHVETINLQIIQSSAALLKKF